MPTDSKNVLKLLGSIIELKDDISEMRHYLNRPVACDGAISLPLGIMGQIMVHQLETESNVLADHASLLETESEGWGMAQQSSSLHKKIDLLMTLAGVIAQLPSPSLKTQAIACHLSRRVVEQCYRVEHVLEEAVASATLVSQPAYLHA